MPSKYEDMCLLPDQMLEQLGVCFWLWYDQCRMKDRVNSDYVYYNNVKKGLFYLSYLWLICDTCTWSGEHFYVRNEIVSYCINKKEFYIDTFHHYRIYDLIDSTTMLKRMLIRFIIYVIPIQVCFILSNYTECHFFKAL